MCMEKQCKKVNPRLREAEVVGSNPVSPTNNKCNKDFKNLLHL